MIASVFPRALIAWKITKYANLSFYLTFRLTPTRAANMLNYVFKRNSARRLETMQFHRHSR